jgi:hypothetical protein
MGGQVTLQTNEGVGQLNALDSRMDDASWPEPDGCSDSVTCPVGVGGQVALNSNEGVGQLNSLDS